MKREGYLPNTLAGFAVPAHLVTVKMAVADTADRLSYKKYTVAGEWRRRSYKNAIWTESERVYGTW